ncbi:MAG TPA: class A beta-lactamase-related serine hydrolase [Candidatus Aminicenantes bacterium]|nr:beta-lactamase family protein [Candidatus Aminicenantes bacterium]HDT13908.1 class A beta-lactamase-related serine hydrolase [Candidatus Aminicenantes bacterium]
MTLSIGPAVKLAAVLVLALALAAWGSGLSPGTADKPHKRADALLAKLGSPREPGAGVIVLRDGQVAYIGTRGVGDMLAMRPIDGRTTFRLASLSKAFTATAVMLLVRDGKLSYEDSLTGIFPDFPEYGRGITVRHLLTHTSGLPDYEDLMPAADPSIPVEETQIDDAGVLTLLKGQKAGWFAPGALWRYSNSGYVVLGLIVERVSGRSFPAFLEERVFGPLRMSNTVAFVRGRNRVPDRAFGYTKEGDRWRFTDQSPTSATLGDGGVYSSLYDMTLWDEAFRRNLLLGEADLGEALTPVRVPGKGPVGPDGKPADYGFGWFLNAWRARPRMWHYGETRGFRTAIQRFTADGLTVIVLANRSDVDATEMSLKVADFFLKEGR